MYQVTKVSVLFKYQRYRYFWSINTFKCQCCSSRYQYFSRYIPRINIYHVSILLMYQYFPNNNTFQVLILFSYQYFSSIKLINYSFKVSKIPILFEDQCFLHISTIQVSIHTLKFQYFSCINTSHVLILFK